MKKKNMPVGAMRMLPHAWKTAGFIVSAVALVAIFVAIFCFRDKILARYCVSIFIAGLYVAAISKEKFEDEMFKQMRFTAFCAGFGFGILQVVIEPLISLAFLPSHYENEIDVVVSMLLFYHLIFWAIKQRARHEKHD